MIRSIAIIAALSVASPAGAEFFIGTQPAEVLAAEEASPGVCARVAIQAHKFAIAVMAGAEWESYRYEVMHDPEIRQAEVPIMMWTASDIFGMSLTPEAAVIEARRACEEIVTP